MKYTLATLAFYASNPGWWTFSTDWQTMRTIQSLRKRGYLEVNDNLQARFTGKVFAGPLDK